MKAKISKWKIILAAVAIIIVASLTLFVNNYFDQSGPPALSLGSQGLKGYIGGERNFFQFTAADLDRVANFEAATERNVGIQYYYAEQDMSFQDIVESVKPDLENQCIVVTYVPEDQKFYTYPRGPFQGTETVAQERLADFTVPAAQAFLVVCTRETATINIKHSSEQPTEFQNSLNWRPSGWHLTVFSSSETLSRAVGTCGNRVSSIWVQDDENHFTKAEQNAPQLSDGYFLAWLKLDGEAQSCRESAGAGSGSSSSTSTNNGSSGQAGGQAGGQADGSQPAGLSIYQHLNQNYNINDNRLQER